jgi:predicted nucleotidyltransferase
MEIMDRYDLNKRYGVKRIGLFSSFVRGEQKETSDVDVLVEFEKEAKTFDNYMNLKFFLEDIFGRKVDLVIIDALKPDIKERILKEVKYAERL